MKQNSKFKIQHLRFKSLFSVVFLVIFISTLGCATTSGVKAPSQVKEAPVLTNIDIRDYSVTLTVSKPFVYTIYRSDDPYKMVVDLPDTSIGAFNSRIVSDKSGITEIIPSQVESPSFLARLELLLQTPSMVEPEYKDKSLLIRVKKEETPIEKPEVRSQKSEVLKEELLKEVKEEKEAKEVLREEPIETGKEETIKLPKATEIKDITIERSARAVQVLIKGNGSMTPSVFPLDNRIVIDIPDVAMGAQVPSAVISPLKGIRSGKYKDKVRLVFDLKEKTNFDVNASGDMIVIALQRSEKEPSAPQIAQKMAPQEEKIEKIEPEEIAIPIAEGKYTGKKISLDFQDTDIIPIFRLLADISGYNIVVSPDVKGKLTMKLINVPWDQALDLILKTSTPPLGKSVEGNIIRIAPLTLFTQESEESTKAQEAAIKAEPLETKIFPISYAVVSEVEKAVKDSKILTPRGSISVDKRTSSMVINDVSAVFTKIEDFLTTLDKPTPQVMIEARIVEVNTLDVKDLGIQWGLNLKSADSLFQMKGFSGLNRGPITGSNYMVDFPSGASPGSGSGFNFGVLNPARTMGLDLQISALQSIGKGKIVSNPRILTRDNDEAFISQGASIPYRMQTAEGTVSEGFKDYTLSLTVTPRIAPDNTILMKINAKKEEPDWTRVSLQGTPASKKGEATTNVIIRDGETVVIGGVFKTSKQDTDTGVPGLMNIPILGWLFKNRKIDDSTSEMLIFITPRIVHKPE
ncbi:MAG: type IV pilus secretin PilQ [Nitrospira sp.]|nr:type IV pilus secretin PilQ [Nitrospira sp.]